MKFTLPDGSEKPYDRPTTPAQVAADIGPGLAKAAIGTRVDGRLWDLHRPVERDCRLALITRPKKNQPIGEQDPDALYLLRHSCAHVMAEAIQRIWPEALLAYGPPLDNGFYYDIHLETPISSDDFGRIEAEMRKIVEEDRQFTRYELPLDAGFQKISNVDKYKKDNAERAAEGGAKKLSWYITGEPTVVVSSKDGSRHYLVCGPRDQESFTVPVEKLHGSLLDVSERESVVGDYEGDVGSPVKWEDLCMGPHVPSTGEIGAFKIMSVASSHWHGDVTSDRFQRVYGTAFFSQQDLDAYLEQLEEAKKRDHRVIGQKLGLFAIDEKVGQGLVLWKPKGAIIRDELQKFISEHLTRQGYFQVFTPHIGKLELYRTSGHFPYYAESQFPPLVDRDTIAKLANENCSCAALAVSINQGDIDGYLLKPMNCPHHIRIYASEKHSYRDLPIRLAEFGTVYRWEQSGELGGMTRVRGFTQDDAHLFVTEEQLPAEVAGCLELVKIIFNTLGMSDYRVRVGMRDPDSAKYVGEPAQWDRAERACLAAAETLGVPFAAEPGEAAEDRLRRQRCHRPRVATRHRAGRLPVAAALRPDLRGRRQRRASAGDDPSRPVRQHGAFRRRADRALRRGVPPVAEPRAGAGAAGKRQVPRVRRQDLRGRQAGRPARHARYLQRARQRQDQAGPGR